MGRSQKFRERVSSVSFAFCTTVTPPSLTVLPKRIARQIVPDVVAVGDAHVLVDDSALDARAAAHVDVVEQDRIADLGPFVDEHVAPEHAVLHEATRDDAAAAT